MKTESPCFECSFCKWYPLFSKNAVEAVILPLTNEIVRYLEHDAFILPVEATSNAEVCNLKWLDGSPVEDDSDEESNQQPSFPIFSRQIQKVIDDFGAVFIKSNWSTASDATWVASTKTLKCSTLEDVYLLLKSSDRISQDLDFIKNKSNIKENSLNACLVLKKWLDIDPGMEFRCFVVNKELVGICQRDVSQYYQYIENEKYDIQGDIKSLFMEKIKDQFVLDNYSFDVIRYKKDKVKILDFGPLNETVTSGTLFRLNELLDNISQAPEFRFIAEEMGIQPKSISHFCVPKEINECFHKNSDLSPINAIQEEVETQRKEENQEEIHLKNS